MAGPHPEERVRLAAIHQSWRDVTFLHWPLDPDSVARLLPDGLEPDLVAGRAWVTITPFRVERFRIAGVPPLPFSTSFCETNLRTYVRNRAGVDGLWFLSLDVSSTLNAFGGRLAAVPYFRSTMSVTADGETRRYRCERRAGRPARHDLVVERGDAFAGGAPEEVELLAGRWRAFTRVGGRLLTIPVEHEPWPLRRARVLELDETLLAAAGIERPAGPPSAQFADGVDARLGPPRPA